MKKPRKDYLIRVPDDGLFMPKPVGRWSEDKYRRLGMYAEMFSTGMKNRIPTRVYIDLFAGAGHTSFKDKPQEHYLSSPLLALGVPDPFAKYIFCDKNPECLDALRVRSKVAAPNANTLIIEGDANTRVGEIVGAIPQHAPGQPVLTFCFVDPFDLGIHFSTIRTLGASRRVDFLILLALAMDGKRNWLNYLNRENDKVDLFLGDPDWREKWKVAQQNGENLIRFLARRYAEQMTTLGYLTPSPDQMLEVKTRDNNMKLYYLAFFSKDKKGYEFWDEVRKYSTDQLDAFLT